MCIYHTANRFPAFPLVKTTSHDCPILNCIGSVTKDTESRNASPAKKALNLDVQVFCSHTNLLTAPKFPVLGSWNNSRSDFMPSDVKTLRGHIYGLLSWAAKHTKTLKKMKKGCSNNVLLPSVKSIYSNTDNMPLCCCWEFHDWSPLTHHPYNQLFFLAPLTLWY